MEKKNQTVFLLACCTVSMIFIAALPNYASAKP